MKPKRRASIAALVFAPLAVVLVLAACAGEQTTTTQTVMVAVPGSELAWARVYDEEGALGGAGMQVVNSVASGGPGLVVVGGSESGGEADAAVWVSTDGYTWDRVPDEEGVLGGTGLQLINSVTAGGPGLVAVPRAQPVQ